MTKKKDGIKIEKRKAKTGIFIMLTILNINIIVTDIDVMNLKITSGKIMCFFRL